MSDEYEVKRLLKWARKNNFNTVAHNNSVKLFSKKHKKASYTIHLGPRALRPLKRFLRKYA